MGVTIGQPGMLRRVASGFSLIAIAVSLGTPPPAAAWGPCLDYGRVSLRGTLVPETFIGPPDYKSISRGDEPRVIWVLRSDRLLCVADPDPRSSRERNETEIELVLSADQYGQYRDLLGRRVVVTGELAPGGARHQKRVLIAATQIEKASVR